MQTGTTSSMAEYRAAVLTVSDSSFRGEREDVSGPAVAAVLSQNGFRVEQRAIVPDEQSSISGKLVELCESADLVVTTGGTGIAERDITPEATRAICERFIEGIPELMRAEGFKRTRFAALSRGVCGIRDKNIILNLPGSPSGAEESLRTVVELLEHALNLLRGNTSHPANWHSHSPQR